MKFVTAFVVGFLALLATTGPISAHHRSGHDGGPPNESASKSHANTHKEKDEKKDKDESKDHHGLHLGQTLRSLSDKQADDLANEFVSCTDTSDLREMKLGAIKRLAHAAGIQNGELKDLLGSDDGHGQGLGRLLRDGLSSEEAGDLRRALREGLESSDVDELSIGRLMQAAQACGLTPHELVDLLDEN